MKRLYSFVLILTMLVAACGGSDSQDDTTAGDDANTATSAAPATGNSETPDIDDQVTTTSVAVQALGDGNEATTFYGNPPGTGTVEVGDILYEFDLNLLCLSMAGAMGIAGTAIDGSDVSVDADFPPAGWETSGEEWGPPSISIDDEGRDIRWEAGGVITDMYPEGSSQVDSFTNDGRLAVGTATFVNSYSFGDDLQVETGQFEFSCPE